MLTIVNENKLGSHPIMIKPKGEHLELDFPTHKIRRFPIENKTQTPKFNEYKPKAYNDKNLTPNIANGYSNNYHRTTTRMEPFVRESAVNNLIRPQ